MRQLCKALVAALALMFLVGSPGQAFATEAATANAGAPGAASDIASAAVSGEDVKKAPAGDRAGVQVGCSDHYCTHRWPDQEGCDRDARTLHEITHASVRIELRYSPACFAAWTRATALYPGPPGACSNKYPYIHDVNNPGMRQEIQVCNEVQFTRMLSFTYKVRACMYWPYSGLGCTYQF